MENFGKYANLIRFFFIYCKLKLNNFYSVLEIPEEDLTPKLRPRSNSADNWSSKDGDHPTRRSLHGASIDRAKDEEKQRHRAVRQDSYLAAVKTISGNNGECRTTCFQTLPASLY